MSTLHLTPSGDPQSPMGWCNERGDWGKGGSQGRTEGGGREGEGAKEGQREEGGRGREPRKDRGRREGGGREGRRKGGGREGGREGWREGGREGGKTVIQSHSSKECFLDQINIIKDTKTLLCQTTK